MLAVRRALVEGEASSSIMALAGFFCPMRLEKENGCVPSGPGKPIGPRHLAARGNRKLMNVQSRLPDRSVT